MGKEGVVRMMQWGQTMGRRSILMRRRESGRRAQVVMVVRAWQHRRLQLQGARLRA
jgi:hypothetical protein